MRSHRCRQAAARPRRQPQCAQPRAGPDAAARGLLRWTLRLRRPPPRLAAPPSARGGRLGAALSALHCMLARAHPMRAATHQCAPSTLPLPCCISAYLTPHWSMLAHRPSRRPRAQDSKGTVASLHRRQPRARGLCAGAARGWCRARRADEQRCHATWHRCTCVPPLPDSACPLPDEPARCTLTCAVPARSAWLSMRARARKLRGAAHRRAR